METIALFFIPKEYFSRKKMALKSKEKKEWAAYLITKEGLTQKEAAGKVGVSVQTMNRWHKEGNWDQLRQSMLVTRQEQLSRLYMQLDELNTSIMSREPGQRFAGSKEADTLSKLTGAIKTLESDASIADVVEVSKRFLNWIRRFSAEKAVEVAALFDEFIRHLLKR